MTQLARPPVKQLSGLSREALFQHFCALSAEDIWLRFGQLMARERAAR